MPYYKTPAVILHSLDFAESDKLVTFFTRDFGKLRGIAKGAKRSRKRFGSGLEPLTCSAVCFFEKEKASLVRLDHCEIVDPFPHIHSDMLRLGYAGYLAELISVTAAERERSGELYALLIGFFELLNQPAFREEFVRIFELRLLPLPATSPSCAAASCAAGRRRTSTGTGSARARGGSSAAIAFGTRLTTPIFPGAPSAPCSGPRPLSWKKSGASASPRRHAKKAGGYCPTSSSTGLKNPSSLSACCSSWREKGGHPINGICAGKAGVP